VFIQLLLIFIVTVGIGAPDQLDIETGTDASITLDFDTTEDLPLDHNADEVETAETVLFSVTNLSPIYSLKNRLQIIPHHCDLFDSYLRNIDLPPLV